MGLLNFIKLIFSHKDSDIEKNNCIENIYKENVSNSEKIDLVEIKTELNRKDIEEKNYYIQDVNEGEVSNGEEIDLIETKAEKDTEEKNDYIQDVNEEVSNGEKIDLVEVKVEFNQKDMEEKNDYIQDINEVKVSCREEIDLSKNIVQTNVISKFIDVYDMEKIYIEGTYKVGMDIPVGEYYFWGQQVLALDRRGFQINSDDELEDFYLKLKKGRIITVEGGEFTMVENIKYRYKKGIKLYLNICIILEESFQKEFIAFGMMKIC